jgi:type II secretory pathway predicted ATPase ExeA
LVDQRIGLRHHFDGMDLAETVRYVKHHLSLAGRSDPLFSADASATTSAVWPFGSATSITNRL